MQEQAMDAPPARGGALDLIELGRRLVDGRTALNLGADDIAQRLHLPMATIDDLETGRVNRIGTPVYLKGFLRSYLRVLGLPEIWAEQALERSGELNAPVVRPAAGAVARRVSWLDRYKWAASYVVGTALALTAVHWLVSNTPQLGLPESTHPTPPVVHNPQILPPASGTTDATQVAASPAGEPGPLLPATTAEFAEAAQDVPPILASLSPFRVSTPASEEGDDTVAPLALQIDANSWIEVRDQAGSKLESKIARAGEQRSFNSGGPFSVSIGNVGGVRAMVGGQAIDLEPYTKGNVARFTVSERAGRWSAQPREADATPREADASAPRAPEAGDARDEG
jgi:cytoskeleton protein RodZ